MLNSFECKLSLCFVQLLFSGRQSTSSAMALLVAAAAAAMLVPQVMVEAQGKLRWGRILQMNLNKVTCRIFKGTMSIEEAFLTNLGIDPTKMFPVSVNPLQPAAYRFLDGDEAAYSPRCVTNCASGNSRIKHQSQQQSLTR